MTFDEHEVVKWAVGEAKLDVDLAEFDQPLAGVRGVNNGHFHVVEDLKTTLVNGIDDLVFAFEISVDVAGCVFDFVGNTAHGGFLKAVFKKQLNGSIEDVFPHFFSFALSSFFVAHFAFLLNNV